MENASDVFVATNTLNAFGDERGREEPKGFGIRVKSRDIDDYISIFLGTLLLSEVEQRRLDAGVLTAFKSQSQIIVEQRLEGGRLVEIVFHNQVIYDVISLVLDRFQRLLHG